MGRRAARARAGQNARARAVATAAPRGRYAIAVIHPSEVSAYFFESMIATLARDHPANGGRLANIYPEWSSANVSQSRNNVTLRFLEREEAEWLLWVDADMRWLPEDVDKLLANADPVERPIVGGLCFGMMESRPMPTIYQFAEIDGRLTTIRVVDYPRDAMVECAATGAAFLLIHRSVLQAMLARKFNEAFPFFQETQNGPDPVGEDITFCLRARQLGYPIWVNTAARIGHHKSHVITEGTFDRERAAAEGGTPCG